MASTSTLLQALFHANPHPQNHVFSSQTPQTTMKSPSNFLIFNNTFPTKKPHHFSIKCNTSDSDSTSPEPPDPSFPAPSITTTTPANKFPIEKRRNSAIIREKKPGLVMPEPPNFEVGWKRTKVIKLEKPKGWVIADFLEKLETLMGMEFGSTTLLAKTGEIVAERAREEAEVLRDKGEVEDRMITELYRVLRLLEMDLAMVKAAVKDETLEERLEQAKARCRQAILVALSF